MVLAYVDGSVVDERVDACFDVVLVHVFEGAVSFQFADSPVVHAFAGIADETADGLADAVSEAEQAFARVDEPDYRRVDYLGVLDASLPVLLFRGMACLDGRVAVLHVRAVSAVERADVVIVVIDATEGVTEQDAKIAGIAHERGKRIIIAVNKWDAIEKDNNTVKQHTEKIRQILSFIPYAEILFISAKSGQRLNKIFELIDVVIENNSMRVATGVLNEIVTEAVAMQQPPTDKGKRLKIYYVTQVSVKPPTFVIFVNDKNLMHFSYTRYLENRIRDTFGFRGTALKFITRERKENE